MIIFLVQELHVNTADPLHKVFNKYFYIIRTIQWCFNSIFTKIPLKIGPGATYCHGIWFLRLKIGEEPFTMTQTRPSQKKTLVNNHSEGGSLFVLEVEALLAGPHSGA